MPLLRFLWNTKTQYVDCRIELYGNNFKGKSYARHPADRRVLIAGTSLLISNQGTTIWGSFDSSSPYRMSFNWNKFIDRHAYMVIAEVRNLIKIDKLPMTTHRNLSTSLSDAEL